MRGRNTGEVEVCVDVFLIVYMAVDTMCLYIHARPGTDPLRLKAPMGSIVYAM